MAAAARGIFSKTAVPAFGIGVAAGTIGTWFEMSHGVICIPVLTLPPLGLTQQMATGTTVFGVAVREILAASFYGLDPSIDLDDRDKMEELVDVNALVGLSAVGTVSALGAAAASARVAARFTLKANGVFCIGLALFLQWRESQMRAAKDAVNEEDHPMRSIEMIEETASSPSIIPSTSLTEDWARLTALGALSGAVLGFFGVGTAWMLAPILRHTAPDNNLRSGDGVLFGDIDLNLSEPFGVDARTRRTACLAMVLPSIASAYTHVSLGHVPAMAGIALPLALGAVGGSIMAGIFLEDVPAEEELKTGVAGLLFMYGMWNLVKH